MNRNRIIGVLWLLCALGAAAQHTFVIDARRPGAAVQPTMWGIFFEDINFGADGGLYAEMVENRSFEFPQTLMGWDAFGDVQVSDEGGPFPRNPHYVTLRAADHREKRTGLDNHGFFGMGIRQGEDYHFSVYARSEGQTTLLVELVGSDHAVITKQKLTIDKATWSRYRLTLTSNRTEQKAFLRIFHDGGDAVSLDHVSLFPADNWHGLRADLVELLRQLHPGVFRFPGGCIVEGTQLRSRYQWKHSVGPAENRPLNENRWNYTFAHRMFPNYYQTYGLGFYELFLLSEHIGATPLPILNVGMACQYQNEEIGSLNEERGAGSGERENRASPNNSTENYPRSPLPAPRSSKASSSCLEDSIDQYVQDALDLIDFANADTLNPWGRLRADMGHPEPFHLKYIGIGNEQWGPLYAERLEPFVKAIRQHHPEIQIVGSAGPSPDDDDGHFFTYNWEQMRRLGIDIVDEHYYRDQHWFLCQAARYDGYSRRGPRVFAGEYACHVREAGSGERGNEERGARSEERRAERRKPLGMNTFEAALSEAALMTGLERNADVVTMCTYAPLLAHIEGWQWRPDLIWMDNLSTVCTPSYYVQQLFATNAGTRLLPLTCNGQPVAGQDCLYASATLDEPTGQIFLKLVNVSSAEQTVRLNIRSRKQLSSVQGTMLRAPSLTAFNSFEQPQAVVPTTISLPASGNVLPVSLPAHSFLVLRVESEAP